jgi:hypothetical protein
MIIWFCVKTNQSPDAVAQIICTFNTFEGETPDFPYIWTVEKGEGAEEYWKILSKHKQQNNVSTVSLVYQTGDTVILGEVSDEVLPNFLAPLLTKYGFDNVKWMIANPKRP